MLRRMGRPKSARNRHLPPRMSARKLATRTLYYYRTRSGGAIPLGSDLAAAKVKWAQLENEGRILPDDSFASVSTAYEGRALAGKAVKTDHEYRAALKRLRVAFQGARLVEIKPMHVAQYLHRRTAPIAANREIAVLSALWNWARETGITDLPNPATGVKRRPESRREVYVTDAQFAAVYAQADQPLRDALDLARLTGQREADILKMRRDDIREGHLWVRQGKTGARIGIALDGELGALVEAIKARPRAATGLHLVQTERGARLSYTMLRKRFDAAREKAGEVWQFRDLRPKAATDMDDVRAAQELLGHRSETTTAAIYRRVRGQKVKPVR